MNDLSRPLATPLFAWLTWLRLKYANTLCLKKVPTFKLSVTLSNLNRFSKFCTAGKRTKFSTKSNLYNNTHLTLGMLLHYLGKLKIQIYCRYSADMEGNANKLHLCAPILIPLCMKLCILSVFVCFYQNLVLVAEYRVDCWQTTQWRPLWRIFSATNWSQK